MRLYSQLLFHLMQVDLEHIKKETKDPLPRLVACYNAAEEYWNVLRKKLVLHDFQTPQEEISFFRNIKPRFIAEIEYYGMLYQLEAYKPQNKEELTQFVETETRRLEEFVLENKAFYDYYKSGDTYADATYFLRSHEEKTSLPYALAHDHHVDVCTSHDPLIARILSLEKYTQYLKSQYGTLTE